MKQTETVTGFTPGPWYVTKTCLVMDEIRKRAICDCDCYFDPKTITANARLIASAPAMFEALQLALPAVENYHSDIVSYSGEESLEVKAVLTKIHAALAQAQGKPL